MKKRFFEISDGDSVKKGEVTAGLDSFHAVRFGLGPQKYKEFKTMKAAVTFMKWAGYRAVRPEQRTRKTREEINEFRRKEATEKIRQWLLEREEFLNMPAVTRSMKIPAKKITAWLNGERTELVERERRKLREMADFMKGIKKQQPK